MSDEGSKKGSDEPTAVGGVPLYVLQKRGKLCLLRQVKGPGAPRDIPLEADEVIIGRAPDSQLFLDSHSVSRQHAALRRSGAGYQCVDLASSNGVFVNAAKIESVELHEGDSIQIGDALFLYQEQAPDQKL
jgi:pSer/pThr/pTyr-binding forkhead associated (FHA) protein